MPRATKQSQKTVRYAVVGLGHIAQVAVLPAFAHAENSVLAALVSDDPKKLDKLGRRYKVKARFSYDHFEQGCRGRPSTRSTSRCLTISTGHMPSGLPGLGCTSSVKSRWQ
jgi:hypothetical protein